MYGCESWTVKKAECQIIDAFELWCWRRLLRVPWTVRKSNQSITNSWSSLRFMSIELVMPSNHLIVCHPLLLLPSIFPTIKVFSNESVLHIRWPKYWSFSFSISPSNEHPDWSPLAFSKTSLNIWKFTAHVLLKPGLENFEHYFTSMWDDCNCAIVWAFFGTAFLWYLYNQTYGFSSSQVWIWERDH